MILKHCEARMKIKLFYLRVQHHEHTHHLYSPETEIINSSLELQKICIIIIIFFLKPYIIITRNAGIKVDPKYI